MSSLTTVLAIMVALEHLYIMFLETIVTSSGSTPEQFDQEDGLFRFEKRMAD